jgi:hypothetical protein
MFGIYGVGCGCQLGGAAAAELTSPKVNAATKVRIVKVFIACPPLLFGIGLVIGFTQ